MKLGKIGKRITDLENELDQFNQFKTMKALQAEGPAGGAYRERARSRPPLTGSLLSLLDNGANREEIHAFLKNELETLLGPATAGDNIHEMVEVILKYRGP